MHISPTIANFWSRFTNVYGEVPPERLYEVFQFGDSAALADELAALVLSGRKRATAGSLWTVEARGMRPPRAGDLSIVTNSAGKPLCVIQTAGVEIVPFDEVSAEFAASEGERDGSLASWREDHTSFFTRDCARIGRAFNTSMPVVCERFAVVYSE